MAQLALLLVLTASGPWQGTWETTYGTLVLTQDGASVRGFYTMGGTATIEGIVTSGGRMVFSYSEPVASGEGWFELSGDSLAFSGMWREAGASGWTPWEGIRWGEGSLSAHWLVVLEVEWQGALTEPEFSFGEMLRTFFARIEGVEVRHRFVHSLDDIRRFCAEAAMLPGEVYLVLAAHATESGLATPAGTVTPAQLADALDPFGDNLRLVHLSACLAMAGATPKSLLREVGGNGLVVSGYTESVDWSESAVVEMLYLSLILEKGLAPARAAEAVEALLLGAASAEAGVLAGTGFSWSD